MNSRDLVIQRIQKQLANGRIWSNYVAPAFIVVALVSGWLGYRNANNSNAVGGYVAAILFFVLGLALLASTVNTGKYKRLLQYAQHNPEKIVWLYQKIVTVNGVPNESMVLGDDEGRLIHFPVRRKRRQPDELMDAFASLFREAVMGFSEERRKLYRRNPQQFRQLALQAV